MFTIWYKIGVIEICSNNSILISLISVLTYMNKVSIRLKNLVNQ